MSWVSDAGTLLVAIGGLSTLTGVILIPMQRRKLRSEAQNVDADAATRLSAAAVALLEPAQDEIKRLERKLTAANNLTEKLTDRVRALQTESADLHQRILKMSKDLELAYQEIEQLRGLQP